MMIGVIDAAALDPVGTPIDSEIISPSRQLTISSTAPVFFIGSSATIQPGAGNLALTSTAPTVNADNSISISPPSGNLVLSSVAPSVGTWVTAFSTTLDTNSDGWDGWNLREHFAASVISQSGAKVRLTLESSTAENLTITSMYIGHAALSGDAYDFDGGQVQVTAGGNGTFVLTAGVPLVTDEMTFSVDETKNLVVSMFFGGGGSSDAIRRVEGVTGATAFVDASANSAATTDVSSGWSGPAGRCSVISKIEVLQ